MYNSYHVLDRSNNNYSITPLQQSQCQYALLLGLSLLKFVFLSWKQFSNYWVTSTAVSSIYRSHMMYV